MVNFSKNLYFNLKFIYKSKTTVLMLILLSCIPILLGIFVLPFYICAPFILECAIILSSTFIFSMIRFKWKDSTLYKNFLTSKNNKYVFYLSLFSTMLIFSLMVIHIVLLILFILSKFNLLIGRFFMLKKDGAYSYNFGALPFGAFYFSFM